jgi:hypothetical protein
VEIITRQFRPPRLGIAALFWSMSSKSQASSGRHQRHDVCQGKEM